MKVCQCKLCNHKRDDPNPLTGTRAVQLFQKFWPWAKYITQGCDPGTKKPQGRQCLVCNNVFRAEGQLRECKTNDAIKMGHI